MKKYELEKVLLTDYKVTENLDFNLTEMDLLFGRTEYTFNEIYNQKLDIIDNVIKQHIESKKRITGSEAVKLINSRDRILKKLNNKIQYAELLYKNGNSFHESLETLLEVSLQHIFNYEKAAKQLRGKRVVPVIVDGNNNNLPKPIKTEITDNYVTCGKCINIVRNLKEQFDYKANTLEFNLDIYTKTEDNELGDYPEECLLNRTVKYYVDDLYLEVWENDKLVSEETF